MSVCLFVYIYTTDPTFDERWPQRPRIFIMQGWMETKGGMKGFSLRSFWISCKKKNVVWGRRQTGHYRLKGHSQCQDLFIIIRALVMIQKESRYWQNSAYMSYEGILFYLYSKSHQVLFFSLLVCVWNMVPDLCVTAEKLWKLLAQCHNL